MAYTANLCICGTYERRRPLLFGGASAKPFICRPFPAVGI